MDCGRQQGVFEHLMMLERSSAQEERQKERLEELRVAVATLHAKKERLRAETMALKCLKDKMEQGLPLEDCETGDVLQTLLICQRMQLKALQTAHSLIGGYDLMESKQGKSVCVSIHTAYEGVYLETFNVEVELTRVVHISRHNIPPCIPLDKLAKQNLQTDFQAFLHDLSLYLNALAGRKQQISLIKERLETVEVIERNQLCNYLVLMCKTHEETEAVLCTLEYGDLTRYLPTHVTIECENKMLIESPQWKKNQELLMESPVHCALLTMKKMGSIV